MKLLPRTITAYQALAILLTGVFLFTATFGITFGMQTNEHGEMSDCPFMAGQTSVCSMGADEHISHWQGMFITIFEKTLFLVSLFVVISAFGALLLFNLWWQSLLLLSSRLSDRWRLYVKQHPHLSLFYHLREVFSQGILNPKIYAPAGL